VKKKKGELISDLNNILTDEHWSIIEELTGKNPKTIVQKCKFLSSIFTKSRKLYSAKRIARSLQQWACQKISEVTGKPWGKDEEIASREMGQSGPDVRMSSEVRKLFPFTIECKSGEHWNLPEAIKQCKANLYENTNWMVILDRPHRLRKNRISPVVVIDGEAFFGCVVRCNHGEFWELNKEKNC